jgi:hypothetical protein
MIVAMARDDQPGKEAPGPWADLPGGDPAPASASQGGNSATRALRMTIAVLLVFLGVLICLIAFGMPTEPGEVERPGFLIPWYALPLIGTAAAVRLWPGGARGAGVPLLIAIISLSGWCAMFFLW